MFIAEATILLKEYCCCVGTRLIQPRLTVVDVGFLFARKVDIMSDGAKIRLELEHLSQGEISAYFRPCTVVDPSRNYVFTSLLEYYSYGGALQQIGELV